MMQVPSYARLVAEAPLELTVTGIAGLEDLDRDGLPVPNVMAGEYPGEPALANQAFKLVGAKSVAYEIFRFARHGRTLQD